MKVLLLNPTIPSEEPILRSERCQGKVIVGLWPPISLAYIAAVIRNTGLDIRILDSVVLNQKYDEMIDTIVKWDPCLVVLQNTTPTIYDDKETARRIKEKLPKCKVAFIGLHATVRPEDIVDKYVDFSVRNEPEYTVKEIVDWMQEGAPERKLKYIRGISYIYQGVLMNNLKRDPIEDLDSLPFPARKLMDNKLYVVPSTGRPFTLIKTSRGCPYQCIYCTASAYYGMKWRKRSAKNIVDEVESAQSEYKIDDFFFSADTFNITREHVLSICDEIERRKLRIKWMCNSRVDNFEYETAVRMKKNGCWLIAFGVESGSDKILKNIRKGATVDLAKKAIQICKKVGIKSMCYFMFGLPGESKETIKETIAFALKSDPDYAHFYIATPFPGTEFFKLAQKNNWLISYDWRRYFHGMSDVISYPELSAGEIAKAVTAAYSRFYFRPSKIVRNIASIRSFKELSGSCKTFLNLVNTWIKR